MRKSVKTEFLTELTSKVCQGVSALFFRIGLLDTPFDTPEINPLPYQFPIGNRRFGIQGNRNPKIVKKMTSGVTLGPGKTLIPIFELGCGNSIHSKEITMHIPRKHHAAEKCDRCGLLKDVTRFESDNRIHVCAGCLHKIVVEWYQTREAADTAEPVAL
jgi:hypothetical protein